MKTKHTAGPWKLDIRANGEIGRNGILTCINTPDNSATIATVYTAKRRTTHDEHGTRNVCEPSAEGEANARLIATAPELAEALRELVQWLDDSGLSHTKPSGKGVFQYEGTEYEVITKARTALANLE